MKAKAYVNSKPGLDKMGSNTNCHPGIKELVRGEEVTHEELFRLDTVLDYRMTQITVTEVYCKFLGIEITDGKEARNFDQHEWHIKQKKIKGGQDAEQAKIAVEQLKRCDTIHHHIIYQDIFDRPRGLQGSGYVKPRAYLSARLAETTIPTDIVIQKLDLLEQCTYHPLYCSTAGF
jgi:hypothetical protein